MLRALDVILRAAPPSSTVYVGGSFGRGEPCIRTGSDGRPALLSDFDVNIIVDGASFIPFIADGAATVRVDHQVMKPVAFQRMGLTFVDCIELVDSERALVREGTCAPGDAAELLTFSALETMATVVPRCMAFADVGSEAIQCSIHRSVAYNLRAAKLTSGYATFLSEWPDGDEPEVSRRNRVWRCGGASRLTIEDLWDSYSIATARMRKSARQAWQECIQQRLRSASSSYAEWLGEMALRAMDAFAERRPGRLSPALVEEVWSSANGGLPVLTEQALDQFFQQRFPAFKQAHNDHKVFGHL